MDIDQIKRDRETWLQALETTTAKQGTGRLGSSSDGFCCLGLGCSVLDVPYYSGAPRSETFARRVGLRTANGEALFDASESLVSLNDHRKFPFAQIAARIRAYMELYFKEETL